MKLEVGMYVRFKDKKGTTYIRKLTKLANEYPQKLYGMEIDEEANYSPYLGLKNILKASHNIIDLIEVGDYVNGYKIVKMFVNKYNGKRLLIALEREEEYEYSDNLNDYMCDESIHIYSEDIKSIVTKEQFESMSYKVKD